MFTRRTVSARAMGPLFHYVMGCGVDLPALLRAKGVDPRWLAEPDRRVTSQSIDGLWDDCAEATDDPDMGLHAAGLARVETFGVISYMCVTSPTVGVGIKRALRYFALLAQGVDYVLEEDATHFRMHRRDLSGGFASSRHDVECTLALPFIYMHRFAVDTWTPTRVHFRHARPVDLSTHQEMFGVTPEFGAEHDFFEGRIEVLDLPMERSDHALSALLEDVTARQHQQLRPFTEPREQALHLIGTALDQGHLLTVDEASKKLGLSTRALQRDLKHAGQPFRKLVDSVRRSRAEALLQRPDLSVLDVAFMLAYADQPSFQRAFRRWFGTTPRIWRSQQPPPTR